jgi:hypothetical protein
MKTYGYDYVFALTLDTVNAILTDNLKNVDQSIDYSTVDPDSGSTITLTAQLAPWQVVGGQNSLINLDIPIEQGSLSMAGGAITGDYDLGGVTPEMQITLGWVGTGDQAVARGSGDETHLTFNPDPDADQNNPGYVATLKVNDPDGRLDSMATGILSQFMAEALFANRDKVAYIFATVNPAPSDLAAWLSPGEWQYFVSQGSDGTGVLCFLCMLTDGAAFPSQPSFDPSALQPSANSVLLISQAAFFEHVVLPAVQSTFPGGKFQLTSTDDRSSIASTGDFDVNTVTVDSYTLSPSPSGDGLAMSSSGGGPLTFLFGLADLPNASYTWTLTTVNPLRYDGTDITFAVDSNPTEQQDTTIPWYDWALLVVLGITDPAGLAEAIYDCVEKFGDQAQNVGMSTIDTDIQNATGGAVMNLDQVITWTEGGQNLTPTTVGMSEAVFIAGNLTISST